MSDNKVLDAVRQLDVNNDNHWTADGLPRLDTVKLLAGDQSLDRNAVESAAPGFKRANAATWTAEGEQAPPTSTTPVDPAATTPPGIAPVTPTPPDPGNVPAAAVPSAGGPVPPTKAEEAPVVTGGLLPTSAPVDGLPTVNKPTDAEGGDTGGQRANDESKGHPGLPPEITQGATQKGINTLATPESDARDAAATTAISPNQPELLGGEAPTVIASHNGAAPASGESEAQLSTLEHGHAGDPDALEALEEELEAASERSNKMRGHVDEAQQELSRCLAEESRLRNAVEQARPRTGTSEAISNYFAAGDKVAEDRIAARKAILESGVDLKQLGELTKGAPIDEAAKANALK